MRHIKRVLSYSMVGSLGLAVVANLQGCTPEGPEDQQDSGAGSLQSDMQHENFFLVIEQTSANPDTYMLAEKHPTEGATRAVLRDMEGNEKIMSEAELKEFAEAEAAKVEAGTSNLTQENSATSGGGLSLGETILAAAAGSLIGGMIANKLANNSNFRQNQRGNSRPGAAYSSRPSTKTGQKNWFKGNKATTGAKPSQAQGQTRRGFFGGNKSTTSSRSSGGSRSFGG